MLPSTSPGWWNLLTFRRPSPPPSPRPPDRAGEALTRRPSSAVAPTPRTAAPPCRLWVRGRAPGLAEGGRSQGASCGALPKRGRPRGSSASPVRPGSPPLGPSGPGSSFPASRAFAGLGNRRAFPAGRGPRGPGGGEAEDAFRASFPRGGPGPAPRRLGSLGAEATARDTLAGGRAGGRLGPERARWGRSPRPPRPAVRAAALRGRD